MLALRLCACAASPVGDAEFDDSFDPAWMSVISVERSALQGFCLREDRQNLLGCARPYHDRGNDPSRSDGAGAVAGRGSCIIYVARELVKDSVSFDYVLRHEAKHCRGWRHTAD